MTTPPKQSSEAEFEAFATTCERLAGFDPRLDPFYVDGWLAVLACGPVRLPASQWLELLCDDAFDRTFADPPDRAQALARLQARLEVLWSMLDAEALLAAPDAARLDPFFDDWDAELVDSAPESERGSETADELAGETAGEAASEPAAPTPTDAGRENLVGSSWAAGALDALDTLAKPGGAWGLPAGDPALDQATEGIGDQLLALLMVRDSDAYREFAAKYHAGKSPSRDDLLLNACFALQDLRLTLLDHGPRPETRRVEAGPGRNDPCPCGSGRKFKKCHGAA
jgi:uncharacterized protein